MDAMDGVSEIRRWKADTGGHHRGRRPGSAVRVLCAANRKPYWLTLEEAELLLGELTRAVQEARRSAIAGRLPPGPPEAGAAALEAA